METYAQLDNRQQKEIETLPIFYAFNNEQFKEGMKKLGLNETDTDKIYRLGKTGGYYKRTDSDIIYNTLKRHQKEMEEAMQNEEFAYQAFLSTLNNNEYSYTRDPKDTLKSLGITMEDINSNEVLKNAYKRAEKKAKYGREW